MHALFESQAFRFLLLGGLAAAINWLSRMPLSLILPLSAAVLVAYGIGMTAGFLLYQTYVFPGSTRSTSHQIVTFLLVNLAGATVVLALTLALVELQGGLPLSLPTKEALAHGIAIGVGAVVSFFGHKFLTFRIARQSA